MFNIKHWAVCGLSLLAFAMATPAAAQLFVVGRVDRSDVRYAVNEVDPEAKVRRTIELLGGEWTVIGASTECGYSAVWSASNGSEHHYFMSSGHPSAREASEAARDKAQAFAGGRRGWAYGIMRSGILNENRYSPDADWARRFAEVVVGLAPCAAANRRGGSTGVRG